jgi:hypothetical protein
VLLTIVHWMAQDVAVYRKLHPRVHNYVVFGRTICTVLKVTNNVHNGPLALKSWKELYLILAVCVFQISCLGSSWNPERPLA